jgi:hypothetical protein
LSWRIGQLAGVKLMLPKNYRISAVDPNRQSARVRRMTAADMDAGYTAMGEAIDLSFFATHHR